MQNFVKFILKGVCVMSEKKYTTQEIQKVATQIRKQILGITLKTGGCYLAQACSSAEVVASLYTDIMNIGPSEAPWEAIPFPGVPGPDNMDYPKGSAYNGSITPENDRLFVSCCHYASVIYAALSAVERISPQWTEKFNVDGWNLEMIGAEHSPGFENTAGSLGQTVSIAAGTAHVRKMRGETGKNYVLMGDGEMQEGQTWECIQAASYYKLDNLVLVIDANGQQVEGAVEDQMNLEPLETRLEAFGAKAIVVDGHDVDAILAAAKTEHPDQPLALVCRTRGTTGVPVLEDRYPLLHFVRIKNDAERAAFQKTYDNM